MYTGSINRVELCSVDNMYHVLHMHAPIGIMMAYALLAYLQTFLATQRFNIPQMLPETDDKCFKRLQAKNPE